MHRLIATIALAVALFASACGDSGSTSSGSAGASDKNASAADDTQFTTGVFPLDLFTAGAAGGLFEQGNVKTVSIDSGPAALPLLQSGSIDAVSGIATVPLATALATGIDYKIVWVTNQRDPMRLVAKGVSTAQDLKGKSVGLPIGSVAHYFFEQYLAENGMKPTDVEQVDVPPPSMLASFERGAIDAAYVWAPFWTQLRDAGGTVLDERDAQEFLAVRGDFVDEHPGAVQAVVCDLARIHGQFQDDPQPLYELLSTTTEQPVKTLEQIYPQQNAGPAQPATPELLGTADEPGQIAEDLHSSAEWLEGKGQVPDAPSLEDFQAVFAPQFAAGVDEGNCS